MFEELTEPEKSGWRRLHWTPNVALLTVLAAAAFAVPAYRCAQRVQIERDGVQTTAIIENVEQHRAMQSSGQRYIWRYSFNVDGRRYHGSWSDSSAYLAPHAGDSIVISYLRSDPNINHHGNIQNQEIDGADIELLVCGLALALLAFWIAMRN